MKLKELLEEKIPIKSDTYSSKITVVYLNPTKEELQQLADSMGHYRQTEIRYIAYMPSPERHYLYVWNSHSALHSDVYKEINPVGNYYDTLKFGYGDLKNGKLKLRYRDFDTNPLWNWLKKYR